MKKFYYKEFIWDVSTRVMPVLNTQGEKIFEMKLYRSPSRFRSLLLFNYLLQEYRIQDGKDCFKLVRQKGLLRYFRPKWQLAHDDQQLGYLKVRCLLWPTQFLYETVSGERFKFRFRLLKRRVDVTDAQGEVVMRVKASIFKITQRYEIEISEEIERPAVFILLFQTCQEFLEFAAKSHS